MEGADFVLCLDDRVVFQEGLLGLGEGEAAVVMEVLYLHCPVVEESEEALWEGF